MPGATDPVPGSTPPLGTSAHDKAMIAKVDGAQAATEAAITGQPPADTPKDPPQPAQVPQRPADVPEKFWDAAKGQVNTEALLKSYGELERAKSQTPTGDPPKDPSADPPKDAPPEPTKVDFAALAQQVQADGKLSEDSLKSLEKAGIDRTMAEQYVAGQQALARERDAQGFAAAGGEQAFTAMAAWAGANYTPAEQDAFNKATTSGSVAEMRAAITALKTRYEAANGKDPKLQLGQGGEGNTTPPFGSHAEVTAAMRDSRYARDPAYRKQVELRLAATDYGNLPM